MTELTDPDRELLLAALASFTRDDPAPFVSGRMVELTEGFFPETWERTPKGARHVALRLMGYAGLDRYAVDVVLDDRAIDGTAMLPTTSADLAGIEGRLLHITCTQLGGLEDTILALAQEVARGALLARRLGRGDSPYRDERPAEMVAPPDDGSDCFDASILAVHLGLGALVAHGAHRYRQAGAVVGSTHVTAWQHVVYGALSPESASYLLAVQLVVRAVPADTLSAVLAPLADERKIEVRTEMARLDRGVLLAALSLPPAETWAPAPVLPVPALREPKVLRSGAPRRRKKEVPVFRIRSDYASTFGFVGLVLGGIGGCGLSLGTSLGNPLASVILPMAIGAVAGWGLGMQKANDECSECEKRLPDEVEQCGNCGGVIAGRIRNRAARFAAADAWHGARAEARTRSRPSR